MEESDEEEAQVQQAAEALMAGEMAPPCLDVTLALRYMTHNGRVTFHQVRLHLLVPSICGLTGMQCCLFHMDACSSTACLTSLLVH